jgi:hypothetical protein
MQNNITTKHLTKKNNHIVDGSKMIKQQTTNNMENGKKPAFQTSIGMSNSEMEHMGLTKREYFAGLAMQGILANANGAMTEGSSRTFSPDGISGLALKHADALLEKLSIEKLP